MESDAYYLYYAQSGSLGKRYWFHTKPNINILINQARADIRQADIEAEILNLIKSKTSHRIELFNIIVAPTNDIPEQTKPTLIILSPSQYGSVTDIPKSTKDVIINFATKKGNSERVYRNTILFLMCSEMGIGKLQSDIREYLAGQKISREYNSQLEFEQRTDLKKRTDDAIKQAEIALVLAYSIVVKHAAIKGIETLSVQNFKDSLDLQINANIIGTLKDEEWLLEAIGLGTFQSYNLLPTPDSSLKVKDVYEAFLRFDDKPMITGKEAVARSLQKYCYNGEYSIATGDGTLFSRYYFQENIPFFEVDDITYWLLDKSLMPQLQDTKTIIDGTDTTAQPSISIVNEPPVGDNYPSMENTVKQFKSISISGKVPLEQYTQIFNSFIVPLAANNIEIEIRIKGKSTASKPLSEISQEYKIVRESAKQLGLNFEEEI